MFEFLAGLGIITLILMGFLIWLLPIIFIAASDKASGTEKFGWILLVIFVSWFAWIFYLIFAPIKAKEARSYY